MTRLTYIKAVFISIRSLLLLPSIALTVLSFWRDEGYENKQIAPLIEVAGVLPT